MTEPTQLPADAETPEVGACYNYEGQNFRVTRVEPGRFITFGNDDEWTDAIEFTDVVGEGETAKVSYVMALDLFVGSYQDGIIDEGADDGDEEVPEVDNELPDETQPEPKG